VIKEHFSGRGFGICVVVGLRLGVMELGLHGKITSLSLVAEPVSGGTISELGHFKVEFEGCVAFGTYYNLRVTLRHHSRNLKLPLHSFDEDE